MSEKEKDGLFENAAENELIDENLDDVSGGAGALKFPQAKCTCPICNKTFRTYGDYKNHALRYHPFY